MEHYGCMLDLYGRAGLLDKAKKVIDDMPMELDVGVLSVLFRACRIHTEMSTWARRSGSASSSWIPQNNGRYMLLANVLATARAGGRMWPWSGGSWTSET
jgi:pentatricopeptide repeat protein